MLRLTWVQPEDLIGHELRQAAEDGRDAAGRSRAVARGGRRRRPRERAGASRAPRLPHCARWPGGCWTNSRGLPSRWRTTSRRTWPRDPGGLPGTGPTPRRATPSDGRATAARLEAAWLGRAAGCLLGKPVEKLPLDGIRALARATGNWPLTTWFTARGLPAELAAAYPWNRRSAATSLAENIDGMPEDDDLNYPLLNLLLLQRYGTGLHHRRRGPALAGRTPRRPDLHRRARGVPQSPRRHRAAATPPGTATRSGSGSAPRSAPTCTAGPHPGDPAAAAEQAHRDAVLTHTAQRRVRRDVHRGRARRGGRRRTADVHGCLRDRAAPSYRRAPGFAHAVRTAIDAARAGSRRLRRGRRPAARRVRRTTTGCTSLPNTALLAAALTHADGDFSGSICRAVSGGWDTDSNGATAGSLAGLLAGSPAALPDRWTTPLKNRLATSVAGFDGIGFDALAELTYQEALRP